MKLAYISSVLVFTSVLSACGGGSSSDNATAESYLQFYNGAANAGNTQLNAGDTVIGTAVYGDVSSVVAVKADSYDVKLIDVASEQTLLTQSETVAKDDKTLMILTEQDDQLSTLKLSFKRDPALEDKFNLHLVNLSEQYPNLDVHIGTNNGSFADAELLESLSFQEVTTEPKSRAVDKYNLYLTKSGETTPIFTATTVNFAYENTYVMVVRDKHGPLAQQLSLDLILNSSTVTAYDNIDASAQFRLYNGLAQKVQFSLDNIVVATAEAGAMSSYVESGKGDFSLSVRDMNGQLLLNSALLSLSSGDSKTVLVYNDADNKAEAVSVKESDAPQLQAHDVLVANLVSDFAKLQFYFVRQNETISTAKYAVKNLEFKKQSTITLPKDYYAIALVQVAENGSTTLLDKTASMMLEPGVHYTLVAEQDNTASSGYRLKLVQ